MYFKKANTYLISITNMEKFCTIPVLIFILLTLVSGATAINIVSTTTVLSDPLDYIGGDNVEVISIASALICSLISSQTAFSLRWIL